MTFSFEDISGTLVNYYGHCKRQAWLFNFGVRMESTSDLVRRGKWIDQNTFSKSKEIEFVGERIKADFILKKKNPVEIHEVKSSRNERHDHRLQIAFYLYKLALKNVKSVGFIHYPSIKKIVKVDLADMKFLIEETIAEIVITMQGECPPRLVDRELCRGCSFFNFCYSIDEVV